MFIRSFVHSLSFGSFSIPIVLFCFVCVFSGFVTLSLPPVMFTWITKWRLCYLFCNTVFLPLPVCVRFLPPLLNTSTHFVFPYFRTVLPSFLLSLTRMYVCVYVWVCVGWMEVCMYVAVCLINHAFLNPLLPPPQHHLWVLYYTQDSPTLLVILSLAQVGKISAPENLYLPRPRPRLRFIFFIPSSLLCIR